MEFDQYYSIKIILLILNQQKLFPRPTFTS